MAYLIILRLVHIVCAVFWTGSVLYLTGFVFPAVKALGPDGGKFMQQLSRTNKLPLVMNLAASLSILAGILLMERISGGFQSVWFGSPHGIVISIGGTLALIAYILGFAISRPTIMKIGTLGQKIAAAGGPPSAEQAQKLLKLRNKLIGATNMVAVLLLGALIAMSIVRYF